MQCLRAESEAAVDDVDDGGWGVSGGVVGRPCAEDNGKVAGARAGAEGAEAARGSRYGREGAIDVRGGKVGEGVWGAGGERDAVVGLEDGGGGAVEGPGGLAAAETKTADGVGSVVDGPGSAGGVDGADGGFHAAVGVCATAGDGGWGGEATKRNSGGDGTGDVAVVATVVAVVGDVEPAGERVGVGGGVVCRAGDVDGGL